MADRLDNEAVFAIIEQIYSASCEPELWPQITAMCQKLLPGAGFSLLLTDPSNELDAVSCATGYDPKSIEDYMARYHAINPYVPIVETFPSDAVTLASQTVSREWLETHAFYHEWLKPAGDYVYGATLPLRSASGMLLRLTYDIPSDRIEDEAIAAEFLERTKIHFRRAFEVSSRLKGAGDGAAIGQSLLDRLSGAAIVVDAKGKIFATSERAQMLLRQGRPCSSDGTDQLKFAAPRDQDAFQAALRSVTALNEKLEPSAFSVDVNGVRTPIVVLPLRPPGSLAAPAGRIALVQIGHAGSDIAPPMSLLRSLYQLTRAEAAVVQQVARGEAIKDISEFNETSQSTVRNQLQSAMQKLGVHRQAELVGMLASLTPHISSGE